MSRGLLIAEKASLKRTIEEVYDKIKSTLPYQIDFMEQRGHIIRLLLPSEIDEAQKAWKWENLPFHPEDHGGWQYTVISEKKQGNFLTSKERYKNISDALKSGKYDFVINAGDPDQEGELLIRETLDLLKNKLPVKRFWTNDLTEKAVDNALRNLRDDDHDPMLVNLHKAALARQHSDYRYGMNLSEATSLRLNVRAAIGRVKTPILAIICKREKEILNFKPVTVYGVKIIYDKGDNFSGSLYNPADAQTGNEEDEETGIIWFKTKQEAEAVIATLAPDAKVIKVEKKHTTTYAPKLFKLATAQTAAGKMGYKADRVLEIIQSLYEKKHMSYPRTDCEYLSSNEDFDGILRGLLSIDELAPYIKKISKADMERVKKSSKWINDKELQSSGHSALCPTTNTPNLASLSSEEREIYLMIAKRFLAMFLPALEADNTTILTDSNGNIFRSTGKTITKKGYTELFGTDSTDTILPPVNEGEVLGIKDRQCSEKTSKCPKRYTDGELIAACENPLKYLDDERLKKLGKELKIGTPATRASIIAQLINKDKYMEYVKEGKTDRIAPTKEGMFIIDNLGDREICKVDMTGLWEEKLQMVRAGELDLNSLEEAMMKDVNAQIIDIKNMNASVAPSQGTGTVIMSCPVCGKDIITGKTSYYCEGFREKTCKVGVMFEICGAKITPDDAKSLFNGKMIEKKMTKDRRSWQQKLVFDKEQQKVVFYQEEKQESKYKCPKCGNALKENSTLAECTCGVKIWRTMCQKQLSDKEWDELLTKHETSNYVNGMISKKKTTFSARLKLKDNGDIEFIFPERKGR